jgi:hypothetical protein
LRQQAESPEFAAAEVLAYHGNVWAAGMKAWLPAGAWDELVDAWHGVPNGAEVVLGFGRARV